jgi:hypothetical protein
MEKFRGHQRCTHEEYPRIMAGRMAGMMIHKKKEKKEF